MRWDELSDFTWDELSYFTWNDMLKGKLELLEQVNQDEGVPPEIGDKLYKLCQEALKEVDEPEATVLRSLTMKHVREFTKFVSMAVTGHKLGNFIFRKDPGSFLELLEDLLKYVPWK